MSDPAPERKSSLVVPKKTWYEKPPLKGAVATKLKKHARKIQTAHFKPMSESDASERSVIATRSRTSSTSSVSSKKSRESSPTTLRIPMHKKPVKQIKTSQTADYKSLKESIDSNFKEILDALKTLQKTQETIIEDLKAVKEHVNKLSVSVDKSKEDIVVLQSENQALHTTIASFEQSSCLKSFNIFGFPAMKQEEAMVVMTKLGDRLGVQLKSTDFKDLFVANHRNKTSSHIAGTFYEERKRDEVFNRQKKFIAEKKSLLMEDIIQLAPSSTLRGSLVKIKTKLTQHTRKLLAYTRTTAIPTFKYIWEKDGRVLIKRKSNSRSIEIKSEQQLLNIIGSSHNNYAAPQLR